MTVLEHPLAVEVIERFKSSYPVDIYAMADALGLDVRFEALPDDISGKIERDWPDDDSYVITVNSRHSSVRQRFTTAHEIAHFILHRDLIGDGIVDNGLYRDGRLGDARERQANRYAATLLMPKRLVESAWANGIHTAAGLASVFGVSTAVAEIRMTELGCVFWPVP